jgi:hypothetical protein
MKEIVIGLKYILCITAFFTIVIYSCFNHPKIFAVLSVIWFVLLVISIAALIGWISKGSKS